MSLSSRLIDSAGNPLPVSVEVARLCQVVAGRALRWSERKCLQTSAQLGMAKGALKERLDAEAAAPDLQSKGEPYHVCQTCGKPVMGSHFCPGPEHKGQQAYTTQSKGEP